MIKQAVILAAGKGKRMNENSTDHKLKTIPKPLLDLKGKPMIEHKINGLVENNIEICTVINKNDEHIFREKLKHYEINYCYQDEPLGTGNALYAAKDFVKDELFLVMMGDDLTEYNIKELSDAKEPAVFGFEVEDVTGYGALVVNNGIVDGIIEKQLSGRGIINTGVFIMPKEFFDYYDEIKAIAKKEILLTDAPEILSFHGIKFKLKKLDRWFGINTPDELNSANRL
ncbi:MAG: nucleotidyltransferase family protein [Candidatus Micrarchaeaceae archaeon]|jgi:NDP-sugar pyrophosphorylase family protein